MDDIEISSISQYIDIIEELQKTYLASSILNNPAITTLIFRGVCDGDYPLLPSVFRQDIVPFENTQIANDKYTSWASEEVLLKSFIAEAVRYIKDIPPQNLCKWAEHAQHYGVPTRFLDWTSNPLAALYFACKCDDDKNAVVWVLHSINYQRFSAVHNKKMQSSDSKENLAIEGTISCDEIINRLLAGKPAIDYPIIYTPYYADTRMSTQSCYFMVWGNKKEPLEKLIPQENYMVYQQKYENEDHSTGIDQDGKILLKLVIHNDRKQSLIRQLDMLGVNEKSLFPGLDGIGRYIERKYRFDYDELLDHI